MKPKSQIFSDNITLELLGINSENTIHYGVFSNNKYIGDVGATINDQVAHLYASQNQLKAISLLEKMLFEDFSIKKIETQIPNAKELGYTKNQDQIYTKTKY